MSISVSFQGEHGAFSEQAALSYFGPRAVTVPCAQFRDVFDAVRKRRVRFGIVPVENSLFGSIAQNYDLLLEYPLTIVGELKLRIRHCLLALPGVPLKKVRHVFSHPQALGQSDRFLRTLPGVQVHQFYDTAGAAKMLADEGRTDAAAVASLQAAAHYGLRVLRKGIETDRRNYTRFAVLAAEPRAPRRRPKTTLAFKTAHTPGSLAACLAAFAEQEIDLLKIESRPIVGSPWEYVFYVDIDSAPHRPRCAAALRGLRRHASFIKVLGSYEAGNVVH